MQTWSMRRLLTRALVGAVAGAGVVALTLTAATWRLDMWAYDQLLSTLDHRADEHIVLVVVDDKSLSALGRWPWSRGVHAALIDSLEPANVRGIAFDVMFAEPNREDPAGDDALALAIQRNGKVVLPVMAEPSQPDGTLIEVLPMAPLIDAAAALGHAEVDTDSDGIARAAYLYAGLGSAHWPSLALALSNLHADTRPQGRLPGLRGHLDAQSPSPYLWNRDHQIMVPYASTQRFQRVSYIDALRGEIAPELLRDRWLLVGATASGISRDVLAPGAGTGVRISGVEYHANLLNVLQHDAAITPLPPLQQLLLGVGLLLLPLVLYRERARVRRGWVVALLTGLATLLACVVLLRSGQLWFAPAPTILVVLVGYLVFATLQFSRSQRLASSDGLTRLANRHMFDATLERELNAARRSNRPLSLLLVDVDHFKAFNDTYGHQAGDDILRHIANILLGWTRRPRDLAARYGGDELALILPESSANAAMAIAESILADVRQLKITHARSDTAATVSVSIGIATYYPILEGHEVDLIKRADAALYRAKREGRNRAHCSSGSVVGG
ncbi:CHASE2 domain-containing protein [Luteimonas sp. RIT-PG2_3]